MLEEYSANDKQALTLPFLICSKIKPLIARPTVVINMQPCFHPRCSQHWLKTHWILLNKMNTKSRNVSYFPSVRCTAVNLCSRDPYIDFLWPTLHCPLCWHWGQHINLTFLPHVFVLNNYLISHTAGKCWPFDNVCVRFECLNTQFGD